MAVLSDDMGGITAYAAAVNRGYTGTKEEFEQLMYSYTEVAERAEAAAGNAHESEENSIEAKDIAVSAKNEAVSARDAAQSARDASISAKNDSESARDAAISAKDDTLAAKDAVMSAKSSVDETSANFSDEVTAAISDVNAAGRNQKELAKTHAVDSEAWAVGQREGADVGVSDTTYHNNSKYYAEQSALARDGSVSARNAAESAKADAISAKNQAEKAKYDAQNIVDGINAKSEKIDQNATEIEELKSDLSAIESAFDEDAVNLLLSNYTTGSYIDIDGTIKEQVDLKYASVSIDTDLIGKTIYVSGSAWWVIKPFVFVDQNNNITYADVPNTTGTVTQHIDIEFKPHKAGTLYINVYASGSNVQQSGAYYKKLSNLKSDYLPDVADSIDDTTEYNIVNIGTLIQSKLLSGDTGAITDNSGTIYYVSDYIAVEPDTYYLISTEQFWSQGLYAFYDENKTYISGRNSNSGGTITHIYNEKVKSPKNAAYLVIGFLYQPSYTAPWLFKGIKNTILPSKKWQNKKWTCVGDSLTESYAVTSMHYFEYVSAATGIETVNLGISGTGYARGSDNFMTRALTVPTDSDVVTFFGSGNDSGAGLELGTASDTGTETLGGCINTAIDNLYSIMPLAQLGIVTPTPWQGNMPSNNGWMERYSNLIVEICKRRSIPCLDLFHCSGLNPNDANVRTLAYSKDNGGGVHPDENGHKLIAPRFKAFLETLLLS